MTDQDSSEDAPLTDQQRSRSEERAARERQRTEVLTELGITRPEAALYVALYYGFMLPPSDLPRRAVMENYEPRGSDLTEDECSAALASCLANGRLQVLDDSARNRIIEELRRDEVLGPIYGGPPDVGCVDFTHEGAALWLTLCGPRLRQDCFAYTDVVHEKGTRYYVSSAVAAEAIREIRTEEDVIAATDPTPIGPWRAQWWRRFPSGFRIDIERRRQWQGHGTGWDESCYLDGSEGKADPERLQAVLDRHNVTLAEWLLMGCMEREWFRDSIDNLCRGASECSTRRLGATVPEDRCRVALKDCLRYGWLRVVDQHTDDEVRAPLADDPTLLAMPRTAGNRPRECCYGIDPLLSDKLTPVPPPPSLGWGGIDFSPAGAALYRMISAEWLGHDWEHDLVVSRVYYWEEHRYSESAEGFAVVAQQHVAMGDVVHGSRVVPIGPWCVRWWERFPSGYRLELRLGDP